MKLATLQIILISLFAHPVFAGAWPREDGQYFIAAGGNFLLSEGAQLPVHYDPTIYIEYGFSPDLTFGLDFHLADARRIGTAFFFVSTPLSEPDAKQKIAASIAIGIRATELAETNALLRGGLAWGMGLENGWVAVDGSLTLSDGDSKLRPKLDFTRGHRWSDNWEFSVQLQTGQELTDDIYAKIAPSITYNMSEEIKLHLGAVQALTGDLGVGLKFETWLTF